jgi:hypothetical protein
MQQLTREYSFLSSLFNEDDNASALSDYFNYQTSPSGIRMHKNLSKANNALQTPLMMTCVKNHLCRTLH